jgi:hypothetical protein
VTEVPPAIATTVTSAPTTVVPAETTVPPVVLSGNRSVHTQVQKNDGDHPNDIPADITLNFFITRDRSVMPNAVHITVSGGGLPTMTGNTVIGPTFDSPGGTASASGGGMYRGFSTSYAIGFTIGASAVSGTITIGGDGGLPGGQPLILSFAGGPPF